MSSTHPRRAGVGFIGLGAMGQAMAANVCAAGFDLTVYNRTSARATEFAAKYGAVAASTPAAVAQRAGTVITMLSDGPALLAVLGGDDGLARGLEPGDIVIDMSTTGAQDTARARALLAPSGVSLVEAPVSGSLATAASAALLVMAAGPEADVSAVTPLLETMAARVVPVGGPGAGAAMKLAVNSVLFGLFGALAEALVLAERAGVERSTAYEVFSTSAVAAPAVHYRRSVYERPGDTPVMFPVHLAAKDLSLALALAGELGVAMPQAETNLGMLREVAAAGHGDEDFGVVAEDLRIRADELLRGRHR